MSIYKVPAELEERIEATAQRTEISHFMDVTKAVKDAKEDDTVWSRMGVGWTSNTESQYCMKTARLLLPVNAWRGQYAQF